MDSDARETRSSDRHYHVLTSVSSFVSRIRRHEHSLHSTANGPAEERPEKSLPSKGVLDGTSYIYHGVGGKHVGIK